MEQSTFEINTRMPRLSLYHPQKSNDYRFIDKTIKEMFTVGATDLYVHKYLGPADTGPSKDITQPQIKEPTATAIQDLMFLETRDRVYDPNIYRMRGHYNVQNLDFDLSQFGLFLTNDVIFITVHYNDMIDIIGRKLMVGDVFELPHLTDYNPLNEALPTSLRRYYQITDANYASEGFSQTWFPHLWRIKCEPLVNSQQFANIMNAPIEQDNYMGNWDPAKTYKPGYTVTYGGKNYTPIQDVPPGVDPTDPAYWKLDTGETLSDLISTYNKNIEINNKIVDEAYRVVPETGYDRSQLYIVPSALNNVPAPPINLIVNDASGPALGTGTVTVVNNSRYKNSSTVVKVSTNGNRSVTPGMRVTLSTGVTAPDRNDTGSGRVFGDKVVTATVNGLQTGPYGTADNTYATADQYVNFYVKTLTAAKDSVIIPIVTWTNDLHVGLVIRGTTYSNNGTPSAVFPPGTIITGLDKIKKLIIVNNPALTSVDGVDLEVAYDFTGTVTDQMDYRADADPRFQFIRRASPRSFGYIVGYGSGNGEAPNGEPVGKGIVFPAKPNVGDYFLRTDYLPQQLFRWDGALWIQISKKVRTALGMGEDSKNQTATFINNNATVTTSTGQTIPSRQSLSDGLRIQPD